MNSQKVHTAYAVELRKLHHQVVSYACALKTQNQPVQHWNTWLTTLVCCYLDPGTTGEWQNVTNNQGLPEFEDIEKFIFTNISTYEVCYISLKNR